MAYSQPTLAFTATQSATYTCMAENYVLINGYTNVSSTARIQVIGEYVQCHNCSVHTVSPTRPFNGPLSVPTRVSRYQKCKTSLDFTEARDSEWQWHQLGHMQLCTLLQTDNHASTPPLSFLQAGCPSCRPTNSIKALKAHAYTRNEDILEVDGKPIGQCLCPRATRTRTDGRTS